MGSTGSSVFVQGGKLLNVLAAKYRTNTSFITRVLLVDPDASELIAYRKRRLGDEPNVLGPEDIRSTIHTLRQAYERTVNDPRQTFEVRTYSQEQVWHIVIIDRRRALLGFYGPGMSGWKWPFMVFDRGPRSFYYGVEEQFDQRWAHARRVIG
jgi:hypothetical protein